METIGTIGNRLYELRAQKEELSEQVKGINTEIDRLEGRLVEMMDEQGIEKASCDLGSLTRKVELYPTVTDKEAFVEFAFSEAHDLGLMVVSANRAAFKAYFETTGEYPDGVDAHIRASINYRRAK